MGYSHLKMAAAAAATLGISAMGASADDYQSQRTSFSIGFEDLVSDLSILSAMVMPGETLTITAPPNGRASKGELKFSGDRWAFTAPNEPGLSVLTFQQGDETVRLNVFVLTPFENGTVDRLNGYRIGAYTKRPYKGLDAYRAPRGFIALDETLSETKISPHFTLGQFICKQQPGHSAKYLLVQPATLIKLEALLDASNARGWRADTFYVMSGYRTPWYNASIGNKTTSSRHLYGGAADIWIDHDGDGKMDDLNGDGKVTKDDARTLAKLAESLSINGEAQWPAGGIGVYGSNAAHGPFVHIDARGYRARWGH